jgi:AsmA protein
VALVIVGAGLLIILPLLISKEAAREAVRAEIRAIAGFEPMLGGQTSVSLFPFGTISFDDLTVGEDRTGNKALTADRLTARLRFLPLLTGDIQVSDLTLVRPSINIIREPDGGTNWTTLSNSLAAALRPNAQRSASFSDIRIENGTVVIRDESRALTESITKIEGSLAWPGMFRSFAATGRFDWRGEAIDASLTISDFLAALEGNLSGVKLRLAGAPLKLAFDGQFSTKPTLKIEGNVSTDSTSLRDTVRWAAGKQLPAGGFGRFALKAKTNIVGGNVALMGVNIELDGNAAEGVLTYASDGRQTVQGTLAAEGVDMTPYVSAIRLLATSGEREWNGTPITLDGLASIDLDLRLSAAQVKLPGTKLGRTAVAANLRGGQLTVTVGESQSFGGIIKGSFDLAKSAAGADVKTHLQFTNVNLDSTLGALFGMQRLEGKGNLSFNIEGSGGSVMAVTKSLNGTATLSAAKGALTGVNVEQLLRRLERRPLSGGGDYRSGRTPFEKLLVNLSIEEGMVLANDIRLDSAAVRLALGGKASIPTRDLDFHGTASLVPASGTERPGFELPFMVRGVWDDPLMLLDTQSLLRRAPAAAPLLDAVRNRASRDAVRSTIDRLVGTSPAPSAPRTEGN